MKFSVGSLVRAREREWVVLPGSDDSVILVQPIGGHQDEATGICLELETVEHATFQPPDGSTLGDHNSCSLLRDAVRFASRNTAGPFRCFSRIGVTPRPYQVVPLLLALRQDPVRLMIADDVGVGKTIEACLIARELLDRGEIRRLVVLCPPHLAEQWQGELRKKFHIDAEVVLSSTVRKLERSCSSPTESLFEHYPYTVVSMDYIKSERNRLGFLRNCPEFVIVDEAHTCAWVDDPGRGRHQRHELIKAISEDPKRHLILVTATPHSGDEGAFRSLLCLLTPELEKLPLDLAGPDNERHRRKLAQYFVQRRRADIRNFLKTETIIPDRNDAEVYYELTKPYKALRDKILGFALETIKGETRRKEKRIRWWSLLALLRAYASSPDALASTLRNRARVAGAETAEEADQIGERTVMDLEMVEENEVSDVVPGGDPDIDSGDRRKLLDMAKEAETLRGAQDAKLLRVLPLVKDLIKEGKHPIIFCRFIPTADYLAKALQERLPKDIVIKSVTGILPPTEREAAIEELYAAPKRVLVATDCMSEGINLQEYFNAVIHYDLSWNPTRHEQRDGRVDRFGQKTITKSITYYGKDNGIDGIVLEVLLRKNKAIKTSLGFSVPVPEKSSSALKAILEGIVLRKGSLPEQARLDAFGLDDIETELQDDLHLKWESAAEREKRFHTMYAQQGLHPEKEVQPELDEAVRKAGSAAELERFTRKALKAYGATVSDIAGAASFNLNGTPPALRDVLRESIRGQTTFKARFDLPRKEGEYWLERSHPIIEGLATFVMDTALDPIGSFGIARRAGVIKTKAVQKRTTLLLIRNRYSLLIKGSTSENKQLVEECNLLGFRGSPEDAEWLSDEEALRLMDASPDQNIAPEIAKRFIQQVLEGISKIKTHLDAEASQQAKMVLASHNRVRKTIKPIRAVQSVEAHTPPDILGVYLFLPIQEVGG